MSASAPSKPEPDFDSAPWWQGLGEHRLALQSCAACDRVRFPRMPGCPFCGCGEWHEVEGPHEGRLYSWVVVQHAFDPAFVDEVPYVIGMVEVAEDVRIPARIELGESEPALDLAVRATFVDQGEWTELRYRLEEQGA